MDDKLLVALVAGGSAIIGGLITSVAGPVVRHWLDRSAKQKDRRREQIRTWRAMVATVNRNRDQGVDVGQLIQSQPSFLTLEPYLTESARRVVYGRTFIVVMGDAFPIPLRTIANEISRIEREWKLR